MPSISEIVKIKKSIRKMNVSPQVKNNLYNTFFKLALKKTFTSKINQKKSDAKEQLMGFSVSHLGFKALYRLFKEIFIDLDYYFETDVEKPFILDCGSNIGMSILFYKTFYPESEIVGFEPDENAFNKLTENIKTNGLKNVTVHQKALSNKEGEVDFFFDPDNVGALHMSIFKERMSGDYRSIQTTVLSAYVTKKVDFLKLDIEGAELDVIKELEEKDKLRMIKRMVIEYHHHIKKDVDEFSQMLSILEKSGFGYQIKSYLLSPVKDQVSQDVLIYAYKKLKC